MNHSNFILNSVKKILNYRPKNFDFILTKEFGTKCFPHQKDFKGFMWGKRTTWEMLLNKSPSHLLSGCSFPEIPKPD